MEKIFTLIPPVCKDFKNNQFQENVSDSSSQIVSFHDITQICKNYLDKNKEYGEYVKNPREQWGGFTEALEFYCLCEQWVNEYAPELQGEKEGFLSDLMNCNERVQNLFDQLKDPKRPLDPNLISELKKLSIQISDIIRKASRYLSVDEEGSGKNQGELLEWKNQIEELEKNIKEKGNCCMELPSFPDFSYSLEWFGGGGSFQPHFEGKPSDSEAFDNFQKILESKLWAKMYELLMRQIIPLEVLNKLQYELMEFSVWLKTFEDIFLQLQKNIQEAGEEKFWELFEVDIAASEENWADVKKFVEKLIG